MEKGILCYFITLDSSFSLYKFDRTVLYLFKSDISPGFFLTHFLQHEYLEQVNSNDQMAEYKVTSAGKEFVKSEIELVNKELMLLEEELQVFKLSDWELHIPFCSFKYQQNSVKILILPLNEICYHLLLTVFNEDNNDFQELKYEDVNSQKNKIDLITKISMITNISNNAR